MRICSLLPSSTEIVFALGLEDHLVAVTHECDYPPEARKKPVVVNSILEGRGKLSSARIDEFISRSRAEGKSVYMIDSERLRKIKPDIIITQGLCDVCAVAENEVTDVCEVLENRPEIISLDPATVGEIIDSILLLGEITGTTERALTLVGSLRGRIEAVEKKLLSERYRPGVFCLEWLEPPYAAGHWVPEMVKIAGGEPLISMVGEPSFKTTWDEILESSPDYLILMPCGFDIEKTLDSIEEVTGGVRQWHALHAVKKGHCYIVDANSYFSRSSPRVVDGIEVLARIIHSDIFTQRPKDNSVLNVKNHFYLQTFLG
ncbi:MAG: cobalamin-binding protein [Candidatus Dadabacteria bacterium]|nr:cobalamin-binding protein [Candidatus Dadabacteria bacterium]MCY4261833.1 cobalamin-binding protein [Candidatus Dadabacteria bacterium]